MDFKRKVFKGRSGRDDEVLKNIGEFKKLLDELQKENNSTVSDSAREENSKLKRIILLLKVN